MKKEYDQSVAVFDKFADEYERKSMDISPYKDSLDFLIEEIKKGGKELLELGCGPGNITKYLKSMLPDSHITGIDLSKRMIDIAKRHVPNADFEVMDIRNIGNIRQKHDGIIASFCIPFLSYFDFEELMENCYDILNDNGVIYLSAMEGNPQRAGFEETSFSGKEQVYFNYYEGDYIKKVLEKNSFKILRQVKQKCGDSPDDLIFIGKKIKRANKGT